MCNPINVLSIFLHYDVKCIDEIIFITRHYSVIIIIRYPTTKLPYYLKNVDICAFNHHSLASIQCLFLLVFVWNYKCGIIIRLVYASESIR